MFFFLKKKFLEFETHLYIIKLGNINKELNIIKKNWLRKFIKKKKKKSLKINLIKNLEEFILEILLFY
jgi:hypothetical protein